MADIWYYGGHEKRAWDATDDANASMIRDPELTFDNKRIKTSVVLEAILDTIGASEYAIDQSKLDDISKNIQSALNAIGNGHVANVPTNTIVSENGPLLTQRLANEQTVEDFANSFNKGVYNGRIVHLKLDDKDTFTSRWKIIGYDSSRRTFKVKTIGLDPQHMNKESYFTLESVLKAAKFMTSDDIRKEAFIKKYGNAYNTYFTTPFIYNGEPYTIVGYDERNRKFPIKIKTLKNTKLLKDITVLNSFINNK